MLDRHRRTTAVLKEVRKKRRHPEFILHKTIAQYCAAVFIPGKSFWHTTENSNGKGGVEGMRHQAKMKVLGVQPGFPDAMILYDSKILFIEIKAPNGTLQPNQEAMHDLLRALGFDVETVKSLEQFIQVINRFGVPTREAN